MAGNSETHNDFSGQITGNSVQVGSNHGSIRMSFETSEWRSLDGEQERLLRSLAGQVRSASDRELGRWGVRDRDALPVRWHTAADNLVDHPEKIYGSAEPAPLDGHFTKILDTYEAVPSKRLVVLGEAGAGKTVLAHRLILTLLKKREVEHARPVPVLFSLSGWNPSDTELPRWLAQQLVRDFPYLGARDSISKVRQAELFVERGFVLPVLDGFDEIPEKHHSAAIGKICTLDLPLIVTSRPDAYATAARGIKAISGAAAITLEPLTLDEARDYLCHTTSKDRAPAWGEVFGYLRTAPEKPVSKSLTTVLTSPLMVVLARTVYNDEKGPTPLDLLDSQRFPTKTAVEDHLLDAYLTTIYAQFDNGPDRRRRPNWRPDRARHWLGYLARHLQQRDTHDLTWWHLPTTLRRRTRVLITAAIFGLAAGPGGLMFGLVVGIGNETRFSRGLVREPERLRLSLRRRGSQPRAGWRAYLKASIVVLTVGLMVELTVGFPAGIAYMLPIVFVAAFVDTADPNATAPWTLLRRDRTVTLVGTATLIVLSTMLASLLQISAIVALFITPIRLVLSAWGNWLLFTRVWLPLTGRLPWRPKRFLEDANARGVLRTTGAVYQFRHAHIRGHLANFH